MKIVKKYDKKRAQSKSEKKKQYYLDGMKACLEKDETVENYSEILNEYETAYANKKKQVESLYKEISIIKKLKV